MYNWRRQRNEDHNQGGKWERPTSGKPPREGNWQTTVPSWEKKFCWDVGRVSWKRLLETKPVFEFCLDRMSVKWDSSAAQEAFENAKSRYWTGLKGLPWDAPLPDPNAHIDEVDWNTEVDTELIVDLERDPLVCEETNKGVIIFGDEYYKSLGFSGPGWGDEGEKGIGRGNGGKWDSQDGDGGEKGWNCDSGCNQWESKANESGNDRVVGGYDNDYYKSGGGRFQGNKNMNNQRGDYSTYREGGEYKSRYQKKRYGDGQQANWNGRRKGVVIHEQWVYRPVKNHGPANQGNQGENQPSAYEDKE